MPTYFKYQQVTTDEAVDEKGCLRDQHSVRVSMLDAMAARAQFTDEVRITDAADLPLGLHRPGFRVAAGQTRDSSHYRAYDQEQASAWQNNPPTGTGSNANSGAIPNASTGNRFSQQREGDLCMCEEVGPNNKQPGRLRRDPDTGALVCVPDYDQRTDKRSLDSRMQDHALRMSEEYEAYDRQQAQAYRTLGKRDGVFEEKIETLSRDPQQAVSDAHRDYLDYLQNSWKTCGR